MKLTLGRPIALCGIRRYAADNLSKRIWQPFEAEDRLTQSLAAEKASRLSFSISNTLTVDIQAAILQPSRAIAEAISKHMNLRTTVSSLEWQ